MHSPQFKIFPLLLTPLLSVAQESTPVDLSSIEDHIFRVPQTSALPAEDSAFYASFTAVLANVRTNTAYYASYTAMLASLDTDTAFLVSLPALETGSARYDAFSQLSANEFSYALATPNLASYMAGLGPYAPDTSLSSLPAASATDSALQASSSSYSRSDSSFAAATSDASSPLQTSSSLYPGNGSSFAAATSATSSKSANATDALESGFASATSHSPTRRPATTASTKPSSKATSAAGQIASSSTAEAIGSRPTAAVVGFGAALAGVFGVTVLL